MSNQGLIETNRMIKLTKMKDQAINLALQNSSLGSIAGFQKYGILRADLSYAMFHQWSIEDKLKAGLEKYYLLKWKPEHLFRKLTNGMVEHQGLHYYTLYHETTRSDLEKLSIISVSFRVAQPEFKLSPIILVSGQSTNVESNQ